MEEKIFNEEIEKYETSTKGHADEFNKRQDKLLENDKYLKSHLEDIEYKLSNYNIYAIDKDRYGIFKVVEYRRSNGTLYMKSILSEANERGSYKKNIWEFYNDTGENIIKNIIWEITYDEDGDIINKVVI